MLETERLVLRRWRPEADLEPLTAICADPAVMRWIADGSVATREQCELVITAFEQHWDEHGLGMYATTLRSSGELIGAIGLSTPTFLPEVLPAVEIGWRLAPAHWGRGLATEAARAALEFGFVEAGLDEILSIHQVGNGASQRVMEKLGMRLLRETLHPKWGRPLRVHELGRSEFAATDPRAANRAGEPRGSRRRARR